MKNTLKAYLRLLMCDDPNAVDELKKTRKHLILEKVVETKKALKYYKIIR